MANSTPMKPILLALILCLPAYGAQPVKAPPPKATASAPAGASWWMDSQDYTGQKRRKTCNSSGCF